MKAKPQPKKNLDHIFPTESLLSKCLRCGTSRVYSDKVCFSKVELFEPLTKNEKDFAVGEAIKGAYW